jgi:hypothetical protein
MSWEGCGRQQYYPTSCLGKLRINSINEKKKGTPSTVISINQEILATKID